MKKKLDATFTVPAESERVQLPEVGSTIEFNGKSFRILGAKRVPLSESTCGWPEIQFTVQALPE